MSTAETEHKGTPLEPHHETHQQTHPSDWTYIKVALILGVLTAIEVSTYYWEKASMHLRYDNPLFRRVFVFGLVLAVVVYLIAMTAMQFWSDGWSLI
jgi:hypothetical protein